MEISPFLRATADDIGAFDFEAPISGSSAADCFGISEAYRVATKSQEDGGLGIATSAETRIFCFLHALTGMHLKPRDRSDPFGPMYVFPDGQRTAIPNDFRGHVGLLAVLAERAVSPVLKSRLADVCWLLDRRRGSMAASAMLAYVGTVEGLDRGRNPELDVRNRRKRRSGAYLRRIVAPGHVHR